MRNTILVIRIFIFGVMTTGIVAPHLWRETHNGVEPVKFGEVFQIVEASREKIFNRLPLSQDLGYVGMKAGGDLGQLGGVFISQGPVRADLPQLMCQKKN